ncbi:hypothetical protein CEUSTIGMA_g9500.t1 [Chlamydomonas eustigma]|uniref:Uncharacterized protein n=1 Tax=Chlamydomonas eustigma TaxID=1157962 RepID=A0A250XGM3_9CHLO|nr:hypothetical protein CEUSTIGMA_g9500.t1 [Chlamydomonas eustigma]|eukprot:GAX82072.1 hypothetical protein CEUSTIGMA_g9500.t1 [Chlamydomonas eustigma]
MSLYTTCHQDSFSRMDSLSDYGAPPALRGSIRLIPSKVQENQDRVPRQLPPSMLDEAFLPSTPVGSQQCSSHIIAPSHTSNSRRNPNAAAHHPYSHADLQASQQHEPSNLHFHGPPASDIPLPASLLKSTQVLSLAGGSAVTGPQLHGSFSKPSSGPYTGVLSPAFLVSSVPQSPVCAEAGNNNTPFGSSPRRGVGDTLSSNSSALLSPLSHLRRDVRQPCSLASSSSGGLGTPRSPSHVASSAFAASGVSSISAFAEDLDRQAGLRPPTPLGGLEDVALVSRHLSPGRKRYSRFATQSLASQGYHDEIDDSVALGSSPPIAGHSAASPSMRGYSVSPLRRFTSQQYKEPRGHSTDGAGGSSTGSTGRKYNSSSVDTMGGGGAMLRVEESASSAAVLGSSAPGSSPRSWQSNVAPTTAMMLPFSKPWVLGSSANPTIPMSSPAMPVIGFYPTSMMVSSSITSSSPAAVSASVSSPAAACTTFLGNNSSSGGLTSVSLQPFPLSQDTSISISTSSGYYSSSRSQPSPTSAHCAINNNTDSNSDPANSHVAESVTGGRVRLPPVVVPRYSNEVGSSGSGGVTA